jgi:hypothetical protein
MVLLLGPLWLLYEFGIVLLVIVPAHKVAQGRVFSVRGRGGESAQAAQTDRGFGQYRDSEDRDFPSHGSQDDDERTGSGSS